MIQATEMIQYNFAANQCFAVVLSVSDILHKSPKALCLLGLVCINLGLLIPCEF